MLQRDQIRNPTEAPEMATAIPDAAGAVNIEEVLRRAREIHRRHGGFFGYDFEDWVQAWSGLAESGSREGLEPADEMDNAEVAGDIREASEPCFRHDN
jgi:hypothetical protein